MFGIFGEALNFFFFLLFDRSVATAMETIRKDAKGRKP